MAEVCDLRDEGVQQAQPLVAQGVEADEEVDVLVDPPPLAVERAASAAAEGDDDLVPQGLLGHAAQLVGEDDQRLARGGRARGLVCAGGSFAARPLHAERLLNERTWRRAPLAGKAPGRETRLGPRLVDEVRQAQRAAGRKAIQGDHGCRLSGSGARSVVPRQLGTTPAIPSPSTSPRQAGATRGSLGVEGGVVSLPNFGLGTKPSGLASEFMYLLIPARSAE